MAITKPPVLPAWAESGDMVTPSNAEIQVGWPLSSIPPSRQRFNWLLNYLANAVRYFSRRGLVDYDAAETYMTGDRIIGDDGKTYRSLIDNNTAQTPSTQPTKWERWGFSLADLGANAQTQPYTAFTTTGSTGAFVLTPSPAITAYAANQRFRVKFHAVGNGADTLAISGLATKNIKQYDSTGAKVAAVIAANQLVDVEYDGVDFVLLDSLPQATVTATNDASFVDNGVKPASTSWVRGAMAAIATAAGFVSSFGSSGYLKLPSWLGSFLFQWGTSSPGGAGTTPVSFPIAFPSSVFSVQVSIDYGGSGTPGSATAAIGSYTTSSFQLGSTTAFNAHWLAIGR